MCRCETCMFFMETRGFSPAEAYLLGQELPTSPTCFCKVSGKCWERGEKMRKPVGMVCAYKRKMEV